MTNQRMPSKAINITLWIAQIILAATFTWASSVKLFQPIQAIATMWPWAAQVPETLVRFTGIVDLVGALGLVLPALLRIRPGLTSVAAACIVVQMICASVFHIVRGEASSIGANVVFAAIAVFIAWGRSKRRIKPQH